KRGWDGGSWQQSVQKDAVVCRPHAWEQGEQPSQRVNFVPRGTVGCGTAPAGTVPRRPHCGSILASLMALAHLAVSATLRLARSAGVPGSTAKPMPAKRSWISLLLAASFTALLSLATMSGGVP